MRLHPLAERLCDIGFTAMADAFHEMQTTSDGLSREDRLGLMLEHEATSRENRRLGCRRQRARLRHSAVIEDTDYCAPRGLDRAVFHKLIGCEWIRASRHLAVVGPP